MRPPESDAAPASSSHAAPEVPEIPDYELLKPIGRGSYGNVWLARTKTGTYRAIKVIHRNAFEADRPYEREFDGIRQFEPVSRSHPSQVDILHVGRNDEAGYFYYVMELADDASIDGPEQNLALSRETAKPETKTGGSSSTSSRAQHVNPETYSPKTLKEVLERRQRISVNECVELATALAEALQHLHGNGLVHRDVKPSNIIFVKGRPKLADIGLVARADATLSFVGTEGYLPPEGPGKPQADLYSLGKVLFEAASGWNRRDFPHLPTQVESIEYKGYLELNEIILKACESHPKDRYPSAAELLADLLLLRKGRSLRAVRRMEKRFKTSLRVGAASLAVAVLAIGAYWVQSQQTQQAKEFATQESRQRQRAEAALTRLTENQAIVAMQNHRFFEALSWSVATLERAKGDADTAARQRYRVGALLQTLPRQESILWPPAPVEEIEFHPSGTRVALVRQDGVIELRDQAGEKLVHTLEHPGSRFLKFNSTGQRCVTWLKPYTQQNEPKVILWDLSVSPPERMPLPHPHNVRHAAFAPDDRWLLTAGAHPDKRMRLWDLASGELIRAWRSGHPKVFEMHPSKPWVLNGWGQSMHFGQAWLWNTDTGEQLGTDLTHYPQLKWSFFSGNGRYLAIMASSRRESARLQTGYTIQICQLNDNGGRSLHCEIEVPSAERLASIRGAGFLGKSDRFFVDLVREGQIWDVQTGRLLNRFAHLPNTAEGTPRLSQDGKLIGTLANAGLELWYADTAKPVGPPLPFGAHQVADYEIGPETPEGRRLFIADRQSSTVRIWKFHANQSSVRLSHPDEVQRVRFNADGTQLLTACSDGSIRSWDVTNGTPVTPSLQDPNATLKSMTWTELNAAGIQDDVFPRFPVLRFSNGARHVPDMDALHSPDGRLILSRHGFEDAWLWNTEGERIAGPFHHEGGVHHIAFSRDGRFFVTTGGDGVVQVWDSKSGEKAGPPLKPYRLRSYYGYLLPWNKQLFASFHPNEPKLVIAARKPGVEVWNWRTGEHSLSIGAYGDKNVERARFSPDGSKLVTLFSAPEKGLQLWDARTGQAISEVFGQEGYVITQTAFNPSGELLITGGTLGLEGINTFSWSSLSVRLWDLNRIHDGQPAERRPIRFDSPVGFHLSPDGSRLLTHAARGVQVWDPATILPLTPPMEMPSLILDAAMAPNNRTVAIARADGIVEIRHLKPSDRSVEELKLLARHQSGKKIVDGTGLVTLSPEEQRQVDRRLQKNAAAQ